MSAPNLLPIIWYYEFYDVPRVFAVEFDGTVFVFDCPFDDQRDDYPDVYCVNRVPRGAARPLDAGSWQRLMPFAEAVAELPVSAVRFDPTHRRWIDASVFTGWNPVRRKGCG